MPFLDTKSEQRENLLYPERISGSEILLRSLILEKVECMFGYPGGNVLNLYDAMTKYPEFRHILTRHEQGAIHAADGYARSTGKVGVCLATSGPGATNLITGIATAYMDSVPLVVITGNVPTVALGTDFFQEADIIGITMPITKHSFFVEKIEDLAQIVREAFYIANSGRKGPVLIDIPKDVSIAKMAFSFPKEVKIDGYQSVLKFNKHQVDRVLDAIEQSKRPIILAGSGVNHSKASMELLEFVNKTNIPVTTTLLGLGGFPGSHDLWLGMPGMHGTYAANMALSSADLLISMGARFDDRVTMNTNGFAPNAKIAHIDIDPAEIGKILETEYPVIGDIKEVLQYANQKLKQVKKSSSWVKKVMEKKRNHPVNYKDSNSELKPQFIIEMINKTTKGNAIITTDVGQHQMWTAQYYQFNYPQSLITSGGLGTMGFGLPSAIGVQIGNPDKLVISINGDGGFQMCIQELAVCALNKLPIKIIILNNQTLGMIQQWQEIIYNGRFSHCDLTGCPDFVKIAEGYGIKGLRATNKKEAYKTWTEALQTPEPILIDFQVSKNELVLPMVGPGKSINEMIR